MRTDAELLARYGATRDEAAFAELVARHAPMVWTVEFGPEFMADFKELGRFGGGGYD